MPVFRPVAFRVPEIQAAAVLVRISRTRRESPEFDRNSPEESRNTAGIRESVGIYG
jgi:hypothetical protein